MRRHITFESLLLVDLLVKIAIEDANAVELLVRVARFLDLGEVLDTVASILNDTINEGKGPSDEIWLAANLADD